MRKLDLDYQQTSRRATWSAWVLLLAGFALCGEMGLSYVRLEREMKGLENFLGAAGMAREAAHRGSPQNYSPVELAAARETIERIAVPWDELFNAVETVKAEHIALLAIEPDPKSGTLNLSGEARDYPALLTYVARLEKAKPLHDVYLLHHEIRQSNLRALTFLITARWGGRT